MNFSFSTNQRGKIDKIEIKQPLNNYFENVVKTINLGSKMNYTSLCLFV